MRLFTILLAALISATSFAATRQEVVQSLGRHVVVRDYLDLAQRAQSLRDAAGRLAANPTQKHLEEAQQAWRDARMHWEQSEAFLFGPVDSLGLDPAIDTWPVNKLDLQAVLGSGRDLNTDFVRNLGANLQGFHTIEYLLFGEGEISNTRDAQSISAQEFAYLKSTCDILVEKTSQIADAWLKNANPDDPSLPGYVDIISHPGANNPIYPSEQAVLSEYVKGIIAILDEVANGKMSDPLGASIENANPALVESPFSWNSLADFANNIRSALNIYTGDYAAAPGPGLIDIVAATDATLAKKVESQLRLGIKKINDIAGPNKISFNKAIIDPQGRARTKDAIDHLNQVRELIEAEVLPIVEM